MDTGMLRARERHRNDERERETGEWWVWKKNIGTFSSLPGDLGVTAKDMEPSVGAGGAAWDCGWGRVRRFSATRSYNCSVRSLMVLRSSLQEEGATRKRFLKKRGRIKSALYGLNAGFFHWPMYCKAPRNQLNRKNWRKMMLKIYLNGWPVSADTWEGVPSWMSKRVGWA